MLNLLQPNNNFLLLGYKSIPQTAAAAAAAAAAAGSLLLRAAILNNPIMSGGP